MAPRISKLHLASAADYCKTTIRTLLATTLLLTLCLVNGYCGQSIDEHMIAMDDETKLYTLVGKPSGPGPFPVILLRTPYGTHQHLYDLDYFTSRGYVFVVQDTRGKYQSEGIFYPFVHEKKDGLCTIDWIEAQDWFNGNLFLYGSSYQSFCNLILGSTNKTSIAGIFNNSGWIEKNQVSHFNGINHIMVNIPWLYLFEGTSEIRRPQTSLLSLLDHLPVSESLEKHGVESQLFRTEGIDVHNTMFRDFDYANWKTPVFHITGWMDFMHKGTIQVFENLQSAGFTEQSLLIGPWAHDQVFTNNTTIGDYDAGPNALFGKESILSLAHHFFEGIRNNRSIPSRIELFRLFDNEWISVNPDNILQEQTEKFYFGKHALLSCIPERDMESVTIKSDPFNPVPTLGGANVHFIPELLGIRNHKEKSKRNDVATFLTEKYSEGQDITGKAFVRLFMESSAPDFDVVVQLVKMDKTKSTFYNITENALRVSYALEHHPELISNYNKNVYEVTLDLGWFSMYVEKGERIGVLVSASNFPRLERNMQTGEPNFTAVHGETADITIYMGEKFPSSFTLFCFQN